MRSTFIALALLAFSGCGADVLHGIGNIDTEAIPNDTPPCLQSSDCAINQECKAGYCVAIPNNPGGDGDRPEPPEVPSVWVGGQWLTEYHLNLADYMGPLADMGSELDTLDQLLMGNSDITDLPIVGDIIQNMIDTYIPAWVDNLVHLLNEMVHFFADVKIQGAMQLEHDFDQPTLLHGEESWNWGYVSIIDNCPLGEADPNYPACAWLPVPLNQPTSTTVGSIAASVDAFDGKISQYDVSLNDRRVQMELSKFVMYILDQVARLASKGQYPTLSDALNAIIDCVGFRTAVENFMCTQLNLCGAQPAVETACISMRTQVMEKITASVAEVTVDWEAMHFDLKARAIDLPPTDQGADKLGNPPDEPGVLERGNFEVLLGADLTGTWSAVRP